MLFSYIFAIEKAAPRSKNRRSSLFSTIHRAGDNAFDDVLLQEDEHDDRQQHAHHHGGHRVLPSDVYCPTKIYTARVSVLPESVII
ncbi:hypothetical protein SAMN04487969_106195 [Paenibacillus algorifonticola]|uniref:Uncharacterized protein n=1 Tax=Paenibacillus algorifonticola TaxID=684063 RepID=A0A1I2D906_9BACL|nr:hypothetical protein SAMN04487969_106195 [Paenibacillus algorifonticola]